MFVRSPADRIRVDRRSFLAAGSAGTQVLRRRRGQGNPEEIRSRSRARWRDATGTFNWRINLIVTVSRTLWRRQRYRSRVSTIMSRLRLGSEYIPLTEDDMSKVRLVVPFSRVAWLTVLLPFLAFVFCVAWSVLYNFEHSTSTHCQVWLLFISRSEMIISFSSGNRGWNNLRNSERTATLMIGFQRRVSLKWIQLCESAYFSK